MFRKGFQCIITLCAYLFLIIYLSIPANAALIPPQDVDNQLVKLVNECIFTEKNNKNWPEFCMKVSLNKNLNFTILNPKDGLGKLLLLPNENIHGVEDVRLFDSATPSYFYSAWENRYLVERKIKNKTGRKVYLKNQDYIFTLNAIQSRTQDRLHIHMACVDREYQKKLLYYNNLKRYSFNWNKLPFIVENPYTKQPMNFIAKKITFNDIRKGRVHRIIREEFGDSYPNFGIAIWSISDTEFLLIVTNDSVLAAPGRILSDNNCSNYLY